MSLTKNHQTEQNAKSGLRGNPKGMWKMSKIRCFLPPSRYNIWELVAALEANESFIQCFQDDLISRYYLLVICVEPDATTLLNLVHRKPY